MTVGVLEEQAEPTVCAAAGAVQGDHQPGWPVVERLRQVERRRRGAGEPGDLVVPGTDGRTLPSRRGETEGQPPPSLGGRARTAHRAVLEPGAAPAEPGPG